jgi:hypothetical protein
MDWPVDAMASQVAQEWEQLLRALSTALAWTVWLGVLVIVLGSIMAASCRAVRSRRFWCPSADRDVEVLFEEAGPPGFRQTLRVMQCSAFEPACDVTCERGCKDATRRHPTAFPGARVLMGPEGLREALDTR